MNQQVKLPEKQPTLRVTTQPNDANPKGDIFGGWLMSKLDIAGAIAATEAAEGDVATVAVQNLQFIHPLFPHDIVSFYTEILAVGNTSVTIAIEAYAQHRMDLSRKVVKIAEASFVYVAVSAPGTKRSIKK